MWWYDRMSVSIGYAGALALIASMGTGISIFSYVGMCCISFALAGLYRSIKASLVLQDIEYHISNFENAINRATMTYEQFKCYIGKFEVENYKVRAEIELINVLLTKKKKK